MKLRMTALTLLSLLALGQANAAEIRLLNVSYDPTRELFQEYNGAFAKEWKAKTGDDVVVSQSHGGSGKQARAWWTGWRRTWCRWRWPTTSMPWPSRG